MSCPTFSSPPGLHLQIPQKTDFYNVSAFSVEYVRLGRLHSVSPAGLSCKPTYIHYVFFYQKQDEYPLSVPFLHRGSETNPCGCVKINQLDADEDGLWGIIHPHTTFQSEILEIFQGTLRMIYSNVLLYLFIYLFKIKLSSLSDSVKSAPNASLLPSKFADEGICRSAFFKRFCSL